MKKGLIFPLKPTYMDFWATRYFSFRLLQTTRAIATLCPVSMNGLMEYALHTMRSAANMARGCWCMMGSTFANYMLCHTCIVTSYMHFISMMIIVQWLARIKSTRTAVALKNTHWNLGGALFWRSGGGKPSLLCPSINKGCIFGIYIFL